MTSKFNFLFCIASAALLVVSSTAQQERRERDPEMMKQMLEGMFQRIDQNADGKLSLQEFSVVGNRMRMQRRGNPAAEGQPRGERRDRTSSQQNRSDERPRADASRNTGERPNRAERAQRQNRNESESAESNSDDQLAQRFNRMDSDDDGELSVEEFVAAMSQNTGNRSRQSTNENP